MKYTIQTIVCGAYQENAYLLCAEDGCILIDPGDDLPRLQAALQGKTLRAILLTHGHFDHMLSAQPLEKSFGAPVYAHPSELEMLSSVHLSAYDSMNASQPCPKAFSARALSDSFAVCGIRFDVLHTPGHTGGSVCFYDGENGILFSGDTLFSGGFGRMDLPTGSPKQMRVSLKKLLDLPVGTRVLCGHGSETTIANERARYRL